ncbi:PelD GGDEF domain-containing protein [Sulfurivirga sp.]|uniref:PelD GGDEF domain-containing protein n=1 Tax=Sulfurivirga sp. TaxID=2614236 RepID=UPI0025E0021F|nr:PelD GGDEF domain-containing protein [Sulfurivirga sp.]
MKALWENAMLSGRQRQLPAWVRWGEVALVTAVGIALGFLISPQDPFFAHGSFPWVMAASLLVALRYGFYAGFISASAVVIALVWYEGFLRGHPLPYGFMVGLMTMTMLTGEFSDYWQRHLHVLRRENRYLIERLEAFTRSYHLLRVSHDQIEIQLAGSTVSLRGALRALYRELAPDRLGQVLDETAAQRVLNLMAQHGSLQQAALAGMEGDQVAARPLARLGRMDSVEGDDPLVRAAVSRRQMVTVRPDEQDAAGSRYLAAIPLVDFEGRVHGLVAVAAMPFFAFEERVLRLLAVLAGRTADMILLRERVPQAEDEEQAVFWVQLQRAAVDAVEHRVASSLVVLSLPDDDTGRRLAELVTRMRRGLDLVLTQEGASLKVLVLLPLTDALGLNGYLQRLRDEVRKLTGAELDRLPVTLATHEIVDEKALRDFLRAQGMEVAWSAR